MNVRDWSLIAFTILAQMAVGSFLVLGVVHLRASRKHGRALADKLSDRALLAIGPVMLLALIASLFHLGTPLNAYRAVNNLDTSWLSREILFGVAFTVVGGLFALMQWRKIGSEVVRTAVAWLAALIGLIHIYSMSRVYMLRTIPTWDTLATPVSFFTTTFLLGILAVGAAYVANYAYVVRQEPRETDVPGEIMRDSLRWIALAAVVLLGVEFILIPLTLAYLSAGPAVAVAAVANLFDRFSGVLIARLLLVFLGAGLLGIVLYQNAAKPGQEAVLANYAYTAFVLVLAAEVLGRILFYASYARVGL